MQTVVERMARVGQMAERVGIRALALAAGLPYSTVRSYADRGWGQKYLPVCDALIAAAERLEHMTPAEAEAFAVQLAADRLERERQLRAQQRKARRAAQAA